MNVIPFEILLAFLALLPASSLAQTPCQACEAVTNRLSEAARLQASVVAQIELINLTM